MPVAASKIQVVPTTPYPGQRPGTSGVRKTTVEFQQPNYVQNFVQSVFTTLKAMKLLEPSKKNGRITLLVSGDGRYFTKEATEIVCQLAAANGVQRVWIGQEALVSTPAASAIIREREDGVCGGGFLLTASHNPGGKDGDFGIKYNVSNGGPATGIVTEAIYKETLAIKEYSMCPEVKNLEFSKIGKQVFLDGEFEVEVIDPVEDWLKLMKSIFDFSLLRSFFARTDFHMLYDGMHGVAGPYAKRLFIGELNANKEWLINCEPKEDFGKKHPDPNLVYARELADRFKIFNPEAVDASTPVFGGAGDGDCDRSMILGSGFFVTPSDSVAVITAYAKDCIPYFVKNGIAGVSRSMPTSRSLDRVAKNLGIPLYEVPTGWKFFGNLMDANKLSICGEESFSTGSNHIREKDGLWAVLCWLSILAKKNEGGRVPLIGVRQIVEDFWRKFGRAYYTRYDYENVDEKGAGELMDYLRSLIPKPQTLLNDRTDLADLLTGDKLKVVKVDEFEYRDVVDGSLSQNQGLRVYLENDARIVYRLSGTGSQGATIRIYVESLESDASNFNNDVQAVLKPLTALAVRLAQIQKFTTRNEPTVIT